MRPCPSSSLAALLAASNGRRTLANVLVFERRTVHVFSDGLLHDSAGVDEEIVVAVSTSWHNHIIA